MPHEEGSNLEERQWHHGGVVLTRRSEGFVGWRSELRELRATAMSWPGLGRSVFSSIGSRALVDLTGKAIEVS